MKIVASGILISLLVSSCTQKNQDLEYGLKYDETLRTNLNTEPPTLDWSRITDTTSAEVVSNIMDGLVAYDLNSPDMALKPALAESWEATDQAKTWTFKLRQGVKWSDGKEFTAQDVLDGWERLLNPATAAEYAYNLFSIVGAKEYNEGKLKDFSQVGVEVKDGSTLVVRLKQSKSFFPYFMTHHSTYPMRKDVVTKHGDKWTQPGNLVTLGPYNLKIWDHEKSIVLERNDSYWGEKAKTKNILMYMILETATAMALYEADKLDSLNTLPSTEMTVLEKRPDFRRAPNLYLYYYGFNTSRKPMDNVLVRKAFNHAIDKNEIVRMLATGYEPAKSWIPTGILAANDEIGLDFNVEKAKTLLDEAGYKDRSKFPRLVLSINTNEDHKRIAENVQAQLKRNLALEIEIRNEEWKVYLNTLKTNPEHIWRMGWVGDFPDPDNFMDLMTSYSDQNRTRWGNPNYDKLVEQAKSEFDPEKRKELYDQAQRIMVEVDVPVVPLYFGVQNKIIKPRVKNYPVNVLMVYRYSNVELEK
ncbi:MAG: oligopeptide-binding protein oppA [Bdellovibrionales bacterium CG10_big_fil_rev_8_21_14_0_10_45_34]|nr:MAG: oligopeptide-binding protein oppA [Bdellovibrionales bacterium CG10_big_fil_rev_8_21_14_0_10_45_34]